jgi:hypothetical protein
MPKAVEVAERLADGLSGDAEWREAGVACLYANSRGDLSSSDVDWAAACILQSPQDAATAAVNFALRHGSTDAAGVVVSSPQDRRAQAELLREVVGNPFTPCPLDPHWLAWNGGSVRKMAQAIYKERQFGDLPVLGDALEEAGCDNREILNHCRANAEHVRGCWVVDLLRCVT